MAKKAATVRPATSPASGSDSSSSSSQSESSSSDRSSASPEPEQQAERAAKRLNPRSSKYKPPKGLRMVTGASGSTLDWDELAQDKGLELWAVRLPDGIKPSALDGLTIQLPSSSKHSLAPITSFKPKKSTTSYDIFVVDDGEEAIEASGSKRKREDDDLGKVKGGEEMRSLVPLLPRRKATDEKGAVKLFQAPVDIKRSLIITRSLPTTILSHLPSSTSSLIDSQPSPVPGAILSAQELLQPEVVRAKKIVRPQPEGLKFRIALPGMGAVGGRGTFHNPPPVMDELETVTVVMQVEGRMDKMEGVEEEGVEVVDEVLKSPKKDKKAKKGDKAPKQKKVKREAGAESD